MAPFDLAFEAPTDAVVIRTVGERFKAKLYYTRVGPNTLISVNPGTINEKDKDSVVPNHQEYDLEKICDGHGGDILVGGGNGATLTPQLPLPHPFEIASAAYLHMVRSSEDQVILTSGETGSGKSEVLKLVLHHLVHLSHQTDPDHKIHREILNIETLLQCFGNAQTTQNINSTRYSRYTELKFNDEGSITGQKIVEYLFEHARVSQCPQDERNFHIFYILLASLSKEEKSKWGLHDAKAFQFLNNGKGPSINLPLKDLPSLDAIRSAFKTVGFTKKIQNEIFQVLAGILHLGNIEFIEEQKKEDGAFVKNRSVLEKTAELFGVSPQKLESAITTSTFISGDTVCSTFLNIPRSIEARNSLASILYQVLFKWIIEQINTHLGYSRLGGDNFINQIGLLDVAGFEDNSPKPNSFDQFMSNYANEKLQTFVLQRSISYVPDSLLLDGVQLLEMPPAPVDLGRISLFDDKNGLFHIINSETILPNEAGRDSAILVSMRNILGDGGSSVAGGNAYYEPGPAGWDIFKIKHYTGKSVSYNVNGFVQKNRNTLQADVINLFGITTGSSRGRTGGNNAGGQKSKNFITGLFSDSVIETVLHPGNENSIVGARPKAPSKPSLLSDRPIDGSRKKSNMLLSAAALNNNATSSPTETAHNVSSLRTAAAITSLTQLKTSIDELLDAMNGMRSWSIICLKPNGELSPNKFEDARVGEQVQSLRVKEMIQASKMEYAVGIEFSDVLSRYRGIINGMDAEDENDATTPVASGDRDRCEKLLSRLGISAAGHFTFGKTRLFLTESLWRRMESKLDTVCGELGEERRIHMTMLPDGSLSAMGKKSLDSMARNKSGGAGGLTIKVTNGYEVEQTGEKKIGGENNNKGDDDDDEEESPKKKRSCCGSQPKAPKVKVRMSRNRRIWVSYTWCVTFWIPDFFLTMIGKKTEGVRMAWREKVALCFIVAFLSGVMLFFVQGFGKILCPVQSFFTAQEIARRSNAGFMSYNGYVYDISSFSHPGISIAKAAGTDVSPYFPTFNPITAYPDWPTCDFFILNRENAASNAVEPAAPPPDPSVLQRRLVKYDNGTNAYCTSPALPNTPGFCHDTWGIGTLVKRNQINVYQLGQVAMSVQDVKMHNTVDDGFVIIKNKVYNFTALFMPNSIYQLDARVATVQALGPPGGDATVNATQFARAIDCYDHLFLVGFVDTRTSNVGCNASAYILYGATGIMVAVMVVKFLAALQLSPTPNPEHNDRFVIMQVPCYNEGESSLLKTIESLAVLEYDDSRKLLFIVSDGMIKSAGSDISTPDMVLRILGVDKNVQQPEAKSYLAIGRGLKEHNKAKIYSGLYSVQSRYVPFIVVVKVGKEGETEKPGNRGKRDSQMILMKFLNRVNFGTPMTPLEIEMYHQIKNIIGVDPFLYEYVLMVDADTKVESSSLNHLIGSMINDANIMGICGETQIENEKESWVTMMQVYEYYISHHMAKAFESLFGSVTCLPGCFCMYRLRTPKKMPLLIANQILSEYQDINVNTLHKQNLLSLGEDRFLTTLMLKHFPEYRNKFTPSAVCFTIVPDSFSMLLGQRRRWINSTIHNLFELVFLPTLCGCLCFSMRLVVFLDLFATLVMPAATAYLGYLIYASIEAQQAPLISLIMLGAAYGLQAIIFLIKHQYQHIGWMVISILAMPVFSFYLPLYAYWHFDDFKWGNTRKGASAEADGGHGGVDPELEEFDAKTIPQITWDEHEAYIAKTAPTQNDVSASLDSTAVYESPHIPPLPVIEPASKQDYLKAYQSGYSERGSIYQGEAAEYGYTSSSNRNSIAMHHTSPTIPIQVVTHQFSSGLTQAAAEAVGVVRGGQMQMMPWRGGDIPTDADIAQYIALLIQTSDLSQLTKKKVREACSSYFGVDMTSKKGFINEQIETLLQ